MNGHRHPQPSARALSVSARHAGSVCMALALLASLLFWLLASTPASARVLSDFREPNQLELAYMGVAADTGDAGLCARISPNALYRVRKPALARSRCYYYLAINTADLGWCDQVTPIPAGAGVMNWLDPERCRYQAGRLHDTGQRFPVAFDKAVLFAQLGYADQAVPERHRQAGQIDWQQFYDFVSDPANHVAFSDFQARLAGLPDFSRADRAEDQPLYFTEAHQKREFDWVLARGMRLCVQGRIGPDCGKEFAKLRSQNLFSPDPADASAKVEDRTPPSGYRRPSNVDQARYDLALRLRDAGLCRAIEPQVLGIGWTVDPGFLFLPLRSACLAGVAAMTSDAKLCDEVVPVARDELDGEGLNGQFCRRLVDGVADDVLLTTLKPDWEGALSKVGFTADEIPAEFVEVSGGVQDRWLRFADHLADKASPGHPTLMTRLRQGEGPSEASLQLSEGDLQQHLYQLSVIRFHCSINRYGDRYRFQGYELEAPTKFGGPFELVDHHGKTATDEDFHGKYLLVFFGYTACPDVCPTNLVAIANTLKRLGDLADRVQPLFISVDARRDTAEILKAYTNYFDPRILGMTGTVQQIRRATKAYQAQYFAGEVDGRYVVDHTAWTYFVGPDGRPIRHFDHGMSPDEMAAEITRTMRGTRKIASSTTDR